MNMDDIKQLIVPIKVFARTPLADVLANDESEALGPCRALIGIRELFRKMLDRDHPLLRNASYDGLINSLAACHVGLVKEALQLSTSASVGCASEMLAGNARVALVFNFGTGGGKASAYHKKPDGALELLFDIKPREVGPSPNDLPLCNYTPKKPKSKEDDDTHFTAFCQQVKDELKSKHLTVDVCKVFVTGPIRESFYNLQHEAKQDEMDALIAVYMIPIRVRWPTNDRNFFLSQNLEAAYESAACEVMYDALSRAGHLAQDAAVVPDASCGIGRGSLQALLGLKLPIGMQDLESVPNHDPNWMFNHMIKHLQTKEGIDACESFIQNVSETTNYGQVPIIPLKSGFALCVANPLFSSKIRDAFAQSMEVRERKRQRVRSAIMEERNRAEASVAEDLEQFNRQIHDDISEVIARETTSFSKVLLEKIRAVQQQSVADLRDDLLRPTVKSDDDDNVEDAENDVQVHC